MLLHMQEDASYTNEDATDATDTWLPLGKAAKSVLKKLAVRRELAENVVESEAREDRGEDQHHEDAAA
jgi:hypothetical protein